MAGGAKKPRKAARVPAWQEEPWTSPNSWKIRLFRFCYRYHALLWGIWWASLLAATGLAFFFLGDLRAARFSARPIQLVGEPWVWALAGLLGVLLLGTLLLVTILGWFGVRFRYLAWGACVLCGAVVRLLRERWRGLVLLVVSLLLAWIGYRMAEDSGLWGSAEKGSFELWQVLVSLAILSLATLLWGGYRTRRRIVVQTFRDLTGLPELESCTKGLSERLCGELAGIAQLYRLIDDMPGGRGKSVYGPAVEVLDVGELLQSAVSSEMSIDLQFFKLPIGPLLRFGSRLLHERWLTGSLHHRDGCLLLLASMSGGGAAKSWRVEPGDLDEGDREKPLPVLVDRMIQQLAYRIATDLVPTGSRKWRAVRSFTEGLRAFREAQRTEIEKYPRLRRAEQAFLRALGEDERFAQCHYNLGVIYGEMGQGEPAEAAYRKALQNDPEPWAACYALAVGYFYAFRYPDALWFAKNAIRIRPDDARAWHLKALTLFFGNEPPLDQVPEHPSWQETLEMEEIAVALAWRDLCRGFARGPAADSAASSPLYGRREETATYTASLGMAHALCGRPDREAPAGWRASWRSWRRMRRGSHVFRQAARLGSSDASSHRYQWGQILFQYGDLPGAARVLDRAFAGGLSPEDRKGFWRFVLATRSALAIVQEDPEHRDIAYEAYGYLLDYIGIAVGRSLDGVRVGDEMSPEDLARTVGQTSFKPLAEWTQDARKELTKALDWARKKLGQSGEDRCADLAATVEALPQTLGENLAAFSARLERLAGELEPRETPVFFAWRLESVAGHLDRLAGKGPEGVAELGAEKDAYFQARLESLDWLRRRLEEADEPVPEFPEILDTLIAAARADWQWARAQAEVCLGMLFLEQEQHAERAWKCLDAGIRGLQSGSRYSLQIVELELHARLAYASLLQARTARRDVDRWRERLSYGFDKAETAVALRPEGADEHYTLGQICLEMGDHERAEREGEACLLLRQYPKALHLIGEARWRRGLGLVCPQARRAVFCQSLQAFAHALELLESKRGSPQDDRGQAHFWVGVLRRELLQFDEAIFHYQVACAMGARPLESRVGLGWAYLEAGMRTEAERTFEDLRRDAARQMREQQAAGDGAVGVDAGRAAGPGDEMPLAETVVRACLGLAVLSAEWGARLPRAVKLLRQALRSVRDSRAYKQRELRARCYEALGWILHCRHQLGRGTEGDLDSAGWYLARAIRLHARCDGYWILAGIHLSRANAKPAVQAVELERAREACENARKTDLRGRRTRDIENLLGQIEKAGAPRTPTWS